ncbi:DNA-formamidopyrimidine glycosylase family protein [Microbacterium indicum]|uniref:DNA-formamidopyrimidine glycosylase family protein n=1 Tax=Microbacterium indicum TaxID=358100 RepID=UPI000411F575|nr:DNA-formamidopyrimidine glycosylase family protein [Microbacterium indicum]
MPEGDTVFRAARRLNAALAGSEVTRFDLRTPRVATVDLSGQTVHEVEARGKHLLMRIGSRTVHSHLGMDGAWHIYAPRQPWRRPAFSARAIIASQACTAVGFDLARLDVVPTTEEHSLVGHLGPDLLGPDWDPIQASENLARDARPIHVALLDQRNLAGLGNVYASEILFLRGVRPTTPAAEVATADLAETGARTIRANRDRSVRTFTGDARAGRTTWVYQRENRRCRRCGTLILAGGIGADPTRERRVFWCPTCQT